MNHVKISIIAAVAENSRAIGLNNELLWHLPEDLKHFKELTSGHAVVMGYNTYLSIGRPLPNRTNIVISKEEVPEPEGCLLSHSIEEALDKAKEIESAKPDGEVFIIGGGQIYRSTIDLADRLYLTIIQDEKNGDAFFPDYQKFARVISKEEHLESDPPFSFVTLEK